jgi:hypothetical protein
LRSRARVRAHWHAFVLAVENVVVDDGMRLPDDEAGIGAEGRSMCVVLGLMQRRRNRMEEKRLRAWSQIERRCREKSVSIILPIQYGVSCLSTFRFPCR